MNFGNKIQIQRKRKGITQEELGEKLNVSRQTITKWESNKSFPEIEKIIKLSYYFNVTIDYLLKDEIENYEENFCEIVEKIEDRKIIPKTIKVFLFLLAFSFVGIMYFYVDSFIHPVTITDWDGTYYKGFYGYLHIHNIEYILYSLIILFIISLGYIIIYSLKTQQK